MAKKAPTANGIEKARKLKLNITSAGVLDHLKSAPKKQFELAQTMGISKQTVAYNVKKLVSLGLIASQDDDAFALTPEGRKTLEPAV